MKPPRLKRRLLRRLRHLPSKQLGTAIGPSLADDRAQAIRERVANEVSRWLAENGIRLSIHHQLSGDAAGLGFATATEMAAELGDGATKLYAVGLWYPGGALVRQLVECGYLITLMSERRQEAAEWMGSSREKILEMFMPRHMRDRSLHDFRVSEYQAHSDWGGHPSPSGRGLLRHHDEWRLVSPRWLWVDLAQHLAEIWDTFCSALSSYDPRMDVESPVYKPDHSPDGKDEISTLIDLWRKHDPLAGRVLDPSSMMDKDSSVDKAN
jgi:hypothetical protein